MTNNIDLSLYDRIELSQSKESNDYIVRNVYTNQYFQVGKEEFEIISLLKKSELLNAKKKSVYLYNGDYVKDLHNGLYQNNVFKKKTDKKKFEFSFKEKKLLITFSSLTNIVNKLPIENLYIPYYIFNSFFSLVSIYCLISVFSSTDFNNVSINVIQILTLIVLLMITTVVHELGHALRLRLSGRNVQDMKILFKKFNLGMQVDVSESYRLDKIKDKVGVAFGGVYTQLAFTGVVSLITRNFVSDFFLFVYLLFNWLIIINNLVPFMKLDGYWIITSILGINNLNIKAQNTFDNFILNNVFNTNNTKTPSLSSSNNELGWAFYGLVDRTIGSVTLGVVTFIFLLIFKNWLISIGFIIYIIKQVLKIKNYFSDLSTFSKENQSV